MTLAVPPVSLVWITPDAEKLLVHMARVSNPKGQEKGQSPKKLLRYLKRNKHWSPFDMVDACFEINTTRDIAHQILRHLSFKYQEFSQRYASTDALPPAPFRECRLQDTTNRQHSIETDDPALAAWWLGAQKRVLRVQQREYREALKRGIAKEVARALLAEGLTSTRMYMKGSIRSWTHYFDVRTVDATQKEHRLIAKSIRELLSQEMPVTFPRRRAC